MRRVRVTLLPWKSSKCHIFWVCICCLGYPACNAHASFCHPWPARLHSIIPLYLINGTIFWKKEEVNEHKSVFWFSLQILSETFLVTRITGRDVNKNVYCSSCKLPDIFSHILMNIKYSWHIFFKNTQIWNFMKVRPVGAELFHASRRADTQTWRS